jgi:hypothetical protein
LQLNIKNGDFKAKLYFLRTDAGKACESSIREACLFRLAAPCAHSIFPLTYSSLLSLPLSCSLNPALLIDMLNKMHLSISINKFQPYSNTNPTTVIPKPKSHQTIWLISERCNFKFYQKWCGVLILDAADGWRWQLTPCRIFRGIVAYPSNKANLLASCAECAGNNKKRKSLLHEDL